MKTRNAIATGIVALCAFIVACAPALATTRNAVRPVEMNARPHYLCGYDGYHGNGQPFYNHCGRRDIVIEVDHFFWQTTYNCVQPGVHRIDQGNSPWVIVGAEYDGHGCSGPGTVVGP